MTMQVMLSLIMQSMQEMQKRLLDAKTNRKDEERGDIEWVRGGNVSLPRFAEWSAMTGPIDFADWINLLEPQMSDLTRTNGGSGCWQGLDGTMNMFDYHRSRDPMILCSLLDSQREELVSSQRLTAMSILCSLLVTYQPGGTDTTFSVRITPSSRSGAGRTLRRRTAKGGGSREAREGGDHVR